VFVLIKHLFSFAPAIMETNQMSYSDKQLQILETAEKLFSSKGFDGTSVRDIADEAGVNVAMISYYFRSKEKLMETLFEQRMGHIKMRVESLLKDDTLTPFQKMEILVDEHIERVMHRQQFHKIMFCEQVLNKNPFIIRMVNDLKLRNLAVIDKLIQDGQKKGAFKKKIDVVMLLNTMMGTVSYMVVSIDYYREYNNLQEMTNEEYQVLIKKKLGTHIKTLFKAILMYEA
jgi:AcrR family transcriptional regulator